MLKALSIKQPFAEQILRGLKKFEYRSRPTAVRGRVYIYAALRPRPPAVWQGQPFTLEDVPLGRIVGTIEIVDCKQEGPGKYSWALESPRRFRVPIVPTRHPQPVWFYPFDRRRIVAKKAKKRGPGKRYTAEEKAKILAAAKKEGLTGAQVSKRFGIAMLTFYKWRGPVRSDAVSRRGKRGRGRPSRNGDVRVNEAAVRKAVRAQVAKLLPQIIREEVEAALR